ncbi:uncharacterized protein LOC114431859 [Parambassis ranga]|uniref:Uncharacterized protein LOC114431859 n=1 Tax=Parambassis ranga TaxID=210632 RepID=A0A6P7HNC4_9TELE|nr:uncharacterized protein LOC114431859 [Parambassis ranga]
MAGNFTGNCLCNLFGASIFLAGCTILLVTAFPVVQIIIGAIYMYECPVAPVIPVYVMVSGIWALLIMALFALPKLLCQAAPGHTVWPGWIVILVLFFFMWLLYGSYQIYSIYPPNYEKNTTSSSALTTPAQEKQSLPNLNHTWMIRNNWKIQTMALNNTDTSHLNIPHASLVMAAEPYCHRGVYMLAFWTTTLVYVFAGNALVMIICLYGAMECTHKCVEYLTT